MFRSKLIETSAYLRPAAFPAREGDVNVFAISGKQRFHEEGGSVYLNAVVSAEGFNERVAPVQLRVLAFAEAIPESPTLELVEALPIVGSGTVAVGPPGVYAVGVPGLEPEGNYNFALIADFPA